MIVTRIAEERGKREPAMESEGREQMETQRGRERQDAAVMQGLSVKDPQTLTM